MIVTQGHKKMKYVNSSIASNQITLINLFILSLTIPPTNSAPPNVVCSPSPSSSICSPMALVPPSPIYMLTLIAISSLITPYPSNPPNPPKNHLNISPYYLVYTPPLSYPSRPLLIDSLHTPSSHSFTPIWNTKRIRNIFCAK